MKLISTEMNDITGAKEHWYWDDVTESIGIKSTFDVSDVLAANKIKQNASIDARYGSGRMHHVAEIPNAFIVKFKQDHNIDIFSDDPTEQLRLRRLLESPDYRFLKTTVKKLFRPT